VRVLLEEVVLDLKPENAETTLSASSICSGPSRMSRGCVVGHKEGDWCSKKIPKAWRVSLAVRAIASESPGAASSGGPKLFSTGVPMSRCDSVPTLAALVVLWGAAPTPAAPPDQQIRALARSRTSISRARGLVWARPRNTTSSSWFTVANGVLSAVTPDQRNTNVETACQYLVSDGSSFTDLQTRDTTYTVQANDAAR